ncbi:MAG: DUF2070 family protein, partial [Candidatus Nanohaloarchaea archaeon]
MATDNVDVFKKIIFTIPSARKNLVAIITLGLLYSGVFYFAMRQYAGNLVTVSALHHGLIPAFWLATFVIPAVVSAELLHMFLPDYPRRWGYFLATCNQSVLFLFMLVLSGANTITNAWNIIWLATTTLFLSNLLILLLTLGYSHVKSVSLLGAVQPFLVLGSFHLLLGSYLAIPPAVYATNLAIILFAGVVLLGALGMVEYLLRANVSDISVLKLSSALLQKKQEALDLGYPTRPEVQSLRLKNDSGTLDVSVPWIHPGPLEGFGGGRITSHIIRDLNENGKGFFFHVPSTHKSDPTHPDDYRKILEAMEEPENQEKASRLVSRDYGHATFYGRRIDGKKVVFMDMDFDDSELSIFREAIDREEVLLVDLHSHEKVDRAAAREELWYNTKEAEEVRESLDDFLEFLEEQEVYDYSAGFEVDTSGTPVFSLVEQVDGQRTLLFGIEGNEASKELLELEMRYR